jgi:thioredoxin reductase
MYDLIVIGGGPAGLTATVYGIRKRLKVLLISKDLGGKTNYHLSLPWIEDYQLIKGLEIVNKFRSELEYLDFARHMEAVEKIQKIDGGFQINTKDGGELTARSVIVASGARQNFLNVPGEREFISRGLSYSAVSYAPLFIDRTVVVVGGGEVALRAAGELATVARHVYLVCEMGAAMNSLLGKKIESSQNVTLLKAHQVVEIKGDDFARSVVVKNPEGAVSELIVDGIFIEKELSPNTEMVADLVKLDDKGRIIIDTNNRTNVPGLFAAGDVTNTYAEQVLVAIGEGAKAALSVYDFLLPIL